MRFSLSHRQWRARYVPAMPSLLDQLRSLPRCQLFGRYALLLLHLMLLPALSVLTEGHPQADILAMLAEQSLFVAAAALIGGRRMLWVGIPLMIPSLITAGAMLALGEIPEEHYSLWAVARAASFIIPIITVGLLILVDVLAAERIVFDLIFGALCVFVLLGLCWANVYQLIERLSPGSFMVDYARYQIDASADPFASLGLFTYYSFVTLTTVGYGDIVPVSALARWLVWLEAVAGQFYMAVFVARLIGLQSSASTPTATAVADEPRPAELRRAA
jgi:voltage-gated potassium channel